MAQQIDFVFWKDSLRLLSTGGMGTVCTSRRDAIMNLYDQIAASASGVAYLNQIYDNAQIELQNDNMQEVTVMDYYYLRDVYLEHHPLDSMHDRLSYVPHDKPVGLAYAAKVPDGWEPDFEQALAALQKKLTTLEEEYWEQEKKLF